MTKSLPDDLRSRGIAAVDAGPSRRAAAKRFSVGIASAIRWVREWRETGSASAKPQAGDRRSRRIDAFREVILTAVEDQVDVTLVEVAEMLRAEHGVSFAASTIWRFLDGHAMTLKKWRTLARRSGPTSPCGVRPGSTPSLISTPSIWFSSTRPVHRRRWLVCVAEPGAECDVGHRSRIDIGRRRRS